MLVALLLILMLVLAACGGNDAAPNGDTPPVVDDPPIVDDPGDEDDRALIDPLDYHTSGRPGFKDGQYFKYEYKQIVDGEETTGWFALSVSEDSGSFEVTYEGVIYDLQHGSTREDYEFSNTVTLPESDQAFHQFEEGRFQYMLADHINHHSRGIVRTLWGEISSPIMENFEGLGLEYVGQTTGFDAWEMSIPGYEEYAGVEGVKFTLKGNGVLEYEVVIAHELPISLYQYRLDTFSERNNEYWIELVEFGK